MKFEKSVIELIKMRKSSRTFDNIEIESKTLQKLKDYIAEINQETQIKARFIFVSNRGIDSGDSGTAKKMGTYGVISGADSFIIGIIDKSENGALEFGYSFEKIVLFATDLGLQTCWLGGTFNRSDFAQNMSLHEDEYIAIVSPVGIKRGKARVFESAMRNVFGAKKRKPWNELFFEGYSSLPLKESRVTDYAIPLEMVRIGPSAANKQPWRIIKDNNIFHFYITRTKGFKMMGYDMQKNDLGIAKCHFELSANELGLKGEWQEMKDINTSNGWEYVCSWVSI
ncbi:MAG: nitroreductase family protein [Eubacteriales bacterium]